MVLTKNSSKTKLCRNFTAVIFKILRKRFSLILKLNHMLYNYTSMILKTALIPIVGKSGFASHPKHTAKATNMDLLHS